MLNLSKEILEEKLNSTDFTTLYKTSYESAVNDLVKRNETLKDVDIKSILKNTNDTLVYAKLYIKKNIDKYRERKFDKLGMRIVCHNLISYEKLRVLQDESLLVTSATKIAAMDAAKTLLFS